MTDGVRLVEATGDALGEVVDAIRKTSETIENIASASREQATGLEEISSAVTHLDQITQQNAALIDTCSSAARALSEKGASLATLSGRFRTTRQSAKKAAARPQPAVAAAPAAAAPAAKKQADEKTSSERASAKAPAAKSPSAAEKPVRKAAASEAAADRDWRALEQPPLAAASNQDDWAEF